jgi:DNA polymerase
MEYSEFTKFISKDVNNYLAVKADGDIHAKGAYVKDLNDLDYDLPIVNEALRNYMIFGTPVETTINSCSDFRKFQKIVKLSSKYKWVEHEQGYIPNYTPRGRLIETYKSTVKYDNKAYRVFASNDVNDGKLLKCDGVRNPAKFGNTPDHCFIENGDLKDMSIPSKLDRQYYIDLAKKRLEDFGL